MDLIWQCGLSVILLCALYWICRFFLHLQERYLHKSGIWQVDLQKVVLPPLKLLFASWGLYYILVFLRESFVEIPDEPTLRPLCNFLTIVSVFWLSMRWKRELFQKKWHMLSMAEVLSKLLSAVFFLLFVLMALRAFHVDIVPLLAFGGIGAAALGFAAKDVLGNFFGGGMLAITRPFSKGDVIILPDRDLEGTVEEMGWYFTSIRDKDKRPIYFPNALFSNVPVINTSRMSHRRIHEAFQLSQEDVSKISHLTSSLREFLSHHEEIDAKAPLLIYWDQVGDYSLKLVIDVYTYATKLEEFVLVKETILQDILRIFDQAKVRISYPTSVQFIKELK